MYQIYIDEELAIETDKTYVDISQFITDTKEYQIKVKCKQNNYYKESDFSSILTYKNIINLQQPDNLECDIQDNLLNIYWDAVDNASSYDVKIQYNYNVIIIEQISENYYNLTLTYGSEYSVSVKANGDEDYYISSDWSSPYNLTYYMQLNSPKDLDFYVGDSYLTVTWDKTNYAYAYEVKCLNTTYITQNT